MEAKTKKLCSIREKNLPIRLLLLGVQSHVLIVDNLGQILVHTEDPGILDFSLTTGYQDPRILKPNLVLEEDLDNLCLHSQRLFLRPRLTRLACPVTCEAMGQQHSGEQQHQCFQHDAASATD